MSKFKIGDRVVLVNLRRNRSALQNHGGINGITEI